MGIGTANSFHLKCKKFKSKKYSLRIFIKKIRAENIDEILVVEIVSVYFIARNNFIQIIKYPEIN